MNRVAGYTYNGAAYHTDCFTLDPDGEDVGVIPTWSGEDEETSCDTCGEHLFESDLEEDEDETGDVELTVEMAQAFGLTLEQAIALVNESDE